MQDVLQLSPLSLAPGYPCHSKFQITGPMDLSALLLSYSQAVTANAAIKSYTFETHVITH